MPVALEIVVTNPALQQSAYTHIRVYRSATIGGVYAEITSGPTRIPLTDAISYTYFDTTGVESDYYRTAYSNETGGAVSAQSAPMAGGVDPALAVISVDELKQVYLFGVDLTNDDGVPYPDAMFHWYIRAAVSWIERTLDITIRRTSVVGERHDYFREEFGKFQYIQLDRVPVISVDQVRIMFPSLPNSARAYDASWIQADLVSGQVEVVPGVGVLTLPFLGAGGLLMPGITGNGARYVPHVHEVDYVAGFPAGQVPDDIRHVVGMVAAMGPLNIAGDLIAGAGVANYSISLDGLSQSVGTTSSATNAGYGSRIIQYQKDVKAMLPILRAAYRGMRAVAV